MTPQELKDELEKVVAAKIMDPLLIMGESGIGKSSIIAQVGAQSDLPICDVRWGQFAPTDARGVPVPMHETKTTTFYPPTFWPRTGPGIIFLDEFNQASPVMMGFGQQLLLDRKFGDYSVPDGVFIWAAGNRKTDMAAVSAIPGPVQNRVAHYEVEHDLWAFKVWAFARGISPAILGFLDWRSELLHKPSKESMAWPSPRTWEMADRRLAVGLSIAPVVGIDASDEFVAYESMRSTLPNVDLIESGRGASVAFPEEPSMRYALTSELIARSLKEWSKFLSCVRWTIDKARADPEWVAVLVQDTVRLLNAQDKKKYREYLTQLIKLEDIRRFVQDQIAAGGLT